MRTSFLLFPILLLAFAIKWSPAVADASPEALRDTDGKKLRTGVEYYILPVVRGHGGGLTLAPNRNGSCPFDVVQDKHETSNGLPLTFTPVDPKKGVIRESVDQNIKFSASTICVQSTVWRLDAFDETTRKSYVTTGGVEGDPSIRTVSNWFKVEKYDDDYKLVFCPNVCSDGVIFCKVLCGDIGVFIDNGVRRLVLSEEPLKIKFKKV